jgi:hypothetical protein
MAGFWRGEEAMSNALIPNPFSRRCGGRGVGDTSPDCSNVRRGGSLRGFPLFFRRAEGVVVPQHGPSKTGIFQIIHSLLSVRGSGLEFGDSVADVLERFIACGTLLTSSPATPGS